MRRAALVGLALSLGALPAACRRDACETLETQAQIDLALRGFSPGQVERVEVALQVGRRRLTRSFDSETRSFVFVFRELDQTPRTIVIEAVARAAGPVVVGRGSLQQAFTPDGCNHFTVVVEAVAAQTDAGPADAIRADGLSRDQAPDHGQAGDAPSLGDASLADAARDQHPADVAPGAPVVWHHGSACDGGVVGGGARTVYSGVLVASHPAPGGKAWVVRSNTDGGLEVFVGCLRQTPVVKQAQSCAAGERLLGGGCDCGGARLLTSAPAGASGTAPSSWSCACAAGATPTTFVICVESSATPVARVDHQTRPSLGNFVGVGCDGGAPVLGGGCSSAHDPTWRSAPSPEPKYAAPRMWECIAPGADARVQAHVLCAR